MVGVSRDNKRSRTAVSDVEEPQEQRHDDTIRINLSPIAAKGRKGFHDLGDDAKGKHLSSFRDRLRVIVKLV